MFVLGNSQSSIPGFFKNMPHGSTDVCQLIKDDGRADPDKSHSSRNQENEKKDEKKDKKTHHAGEAEQKPDQEDKQHIDKQRKRNPWKVVWEGLKKGYYWWNGFVTTIWKVATGPILISVVITSQDVESNSLVLLLHGTRASCLEKGRRDEEIKRKKSKIAVPKCVVFILRLTTRYS